ncbi:calcineurin-like phosphoesterase superfamily domain protein [Peptococcaceae bacterium CEB3]|nr:calcineurin-like phosphoesterase superfamily domain protein [Peptococcaceae bacterium CEB3]
MTKLFFATDVHGSDKCWKKFVSAGKFYKAEILILGGDMTGKAIVPVMETKGGFKTTFLEQDYMMHSREETAQMEELIRNRGYYPIRMDSDRMADLEAHPEKVNDLFIDVAVSTVEKWMDYAEDKLKNSGIKCYVCPGNDDMFEIDEVIRKSELVELTEGKVIRLDEQHEMISTGWSNPTPWNTHRECPEDELRRKIDPMAEQVENLSQCIFNFHCPPYNSGLDEAPELDKDLRPRYAGRSLVPVGSKAVKEAIETYRPLLGLFGHIHEGKGVKKLKKSICINPGSSYEQGVLMGTLIELDNKGVRSYVLTSG